MPFNHLIICPPLLLLPTISPSIRVFSNESVLHIRWPKYWSFSFSPSNEYLGLIFLRNDWFDLLAVQGTLKSLLQDHKWNESESRSVCLTHCNSPWNSLGQATGVGSQSLLQEIFPTQGLNPGLPHYRQILYHLSHQGSSWCI